MKKSILALAFWALASCAALAQTPPANTVWAGPTTGSEGFPSWRALVNADLTTGVGVCTGTATALQYNNAGAFGCITGATSNGTAVTFGNNDIILKGSSTGTTTFSSANAGASSFTLTFPGVTDTLATIGTAQTWTAVQTYTNSDIKLLGSSTGATTFTSDNAGASNFTLHFPAANDTIDVLGTAQSITATKTFTNSTIKLLGSSTGATTFTSANSGSSNFTLTFPAVTDTLAALATAQSWTAVQTFTNSDIKLLGSSTGATTFTSANAGSSNFTLTFPAVTDTLAVLGTAQTFSANQTFSAAILATGITTDATHTDATVCEDTTSHQLYFGSGAAGICLGTSSLRFKHEVAPLDVGLQQIMALEPIKYKLNPDHGDPEKLLYGFSAEQGGTALPKLTGLDKEGRPNTFDYVGVVPVLVKAIQQQQEEIEQLKAALNAKK